jgi:hypothetical protein
LGTDLASAVVPDLIQALADNEKTVRSEAISTLSWLGPEAKVALPALLQIVINKNEVGIREAGLIALLAIDPEYSFILPYLQRLRDIPTRSVLLETLREIGPSARSLRLKLQKSWTLSSVRLQSGQRAPELSQIPEIESSAEQELDLEDEDQTSNPDTREDNPGNTSRPNLSLMAVGVEDGKKWHIFRRRSTEWRHLGRLDELKGGLRAKLLHKFAEHGGLLARVIALKTRARSWKS